MIPAIGRGTHRFSNLRDYSAAALAVVELAE
jgi:hypothetical protein